MIGGRENAAAENRGNGETSQKGTKGREVGERRPTNERINGEASVEKGITTGMTYHRRGRDRATSEREMSRGKSESGEQNQNAGTEQLSHEGRGNISTANERTEARQKLD